MVHDASVGVGCVRVCLSPGSPGTKFSCSKNELVVAFLRATIRPPSSKEGTRPPGVMRLHDWEKAARPALPSQRQVLELSCGGSARPFLYSVLQFPGSPKWASGPQSPRLQPLVCSAGELALSEVGFTRCF